MEICHLLADTFQERHGLMKFIIHLLPSKGSLCKLSKADHKQKAPTLNCPNSQLFLGTRGTGKLGEETFGFQGRTYSSVFFPFAKLGTFNALKWNKGTSLSDKMKSQPSSLEHCLPTRKSPALSVCIFLELNSHAHLAWKLRILCLLG